MGTILCYQSIDIYKPLKIKGDGGVNSLKGNTFGLLREVHILLLSNGEAPIPKIMWEWDQVEVRYIRAQQFSNMIMHGMVNIFMVPFFCPFY